MIKTKTNLFTLFSILFLLFSSSYSIAQDDGKKKDKKYKWGCAVAVNSVEAQIGDPEWDSWGYATSNFKANGDIANKSISLCIILKYFINNDFLLRFECGITSINLTNYYDSQSGISNSSHVIINQNIKQKIYRFIPGIQWNFIKLKYIEFYVGIITSYLHYKDMNYHNVYETRDLPNNTFTSGFDDKMVAKGGFAEGIGCFAGFNIYLQKHILFGAEFSTSLEYKKIGGGFSGVTKRQTIPDPIITEFYSYSTSSYKGLQFSKILTSFNISILF